METKEGENILTKSREFLSIERKKEKDKLFAKTSFSVPEYRKLMSLYSSTVAEYGVDLDMMDRKIFKQFFHTNFDLTEDILLDQIFDFFNHNVELDDNEISREEWILGFDVFLKGSEEDLTKFCFYIYDLNGDGYISKEEMMTLMAGSMGLEVDSDEDVRVR